MGVFASEEGLDLTDFEAPFNLLSTLVWRLSEDIFLLRVNCPRWRSERLWEAFLRKDERVLSSAEERNWGKEPLNGLNSSRAHKII